MINRKFEITMLTIVWILFILTSAIDIAVGLAADSITKMGIELVLLSLWTISVVRRKPSR